MADIKIKPMMKTRQEDPTLLGPMFSLCRSLGLMPSRFQFLPSLLHLALTTFVLVAKIQEVVQVWQNGAQKSTKRSIKLVLYTLAGIPDIFAVFIHLKIIHSKGHLLTTNFRRFTVKKCPTLYSRYIVPLGVVIQPLIMVFVFLQFELNPRIIIVHIFYYNNTYLILMIFCTYLELIRAEMEKLLPLKKSSAVASVGIQLEMMRQAVWCREFFTYQLMAITIRLLLYIIVKVYHTVFFAQKNKTFLSYLAQLLSLAQELFLLATMTSSCEQTLNQVEAFDQQLFALIRRNPDLSKNIIAASLVYLVVLLQFSQ